jgi:hypothetical protein
VSLDGLLHLVYAMGACVALNLLVSIVILILLRLR